LTAVTVHTEPDSVDRHDHHNAVAVRR
jgi:hypothetical protein